MPFRRRPRFVSRVGVAAQERCASTQLAANRQMAQLVHQTSPHVWPAPWLTRCLNRCLTRWLTFCLARFFARCLARSFILLVIIAPAQAATFAREEVAADRSTGEEFEPLRPGEIKEAFHEPWVVMEELKRLRNPDAALANAAAVATEGL